jgi:hypothetical protein
VWIGVDINLRLRLPLLVMKSVLVVVVPPVVALGLLLKGPIIRFVISCSLWLPGRFFRPVGVKDRMVMPCRAAGLESVV